MRITRRPPTFGRGVGDATPVGDSTPLGETSPLGDAASTDAPRGGGTVTDRVQLSDAARLWQRLKADVGDPTAATADVPALQVQVANGTYAPSPRAIADRLLGELTADLLA